MKGTHSSVLARRSVRINGVSCPTHSQLLSRLLQVVEERKHHP